MNWEAQRRMDQAAIRFADHNSSRIANATTTKQVIASITAVAAGAASDGNAKVTVLWRGESVVASGYAAAYTPAVGHRVVCDYIDSQLIVAYRIIGQP